MLHLSQIGEESPVDIPELVLRLQGFGVAFLPPVRSSAARTALGLIGAKNVAPNTWLP